MSIKAQDLRLNNWIILNWDGEKRFQRITGILDDHCLIEEWSEDFAYSELQPIEISQDILVKMGFDKREDIFVFQPELENWCYRVKQVPINSWNISQGFFNYDAEVTTVQFVHELQNVIYFLLKQEVELSL